MKKLSIIIPAHNEEKRLKSTLESYCRFFDVLKQEQELDYELVVVLNGCVDGTYGVVQEAQERYPAISMIELEQAGKGLAVKAGFQNALQRKNDLIGFVDADMATSPEHFYDLVTNLDENDGIVASRYMRGAQVYPPRPKYKRWGSWIVYESLVKLLFGMRYKDYQCGAKLFKRSVIEKITPHLSVRQWAFDIELLYLCSRFGFKVREYPTVWHDKEGSKLDPLGGGVPMLIDLFRIRFRYMPFKKMK